MKNPYEKKNTKTKWYKTFKFKVVSIITAFVLVVGVGVIGVLSATQQKAGISTRLNYTVRDVNCRIYFDVAHKSGESITTMVPKNNGSTLATETDSQSPYQGKYYLDVNTASNSNISISFDKVDLKEEASILPNGDTIYTGYVDYNFIIVNKGSRDILVTVDENEMNNMKDSLTNLVVDKTFDLGAGRTSANSSTITILNSNYVTDNGALPGANTGTADTEATVSMQVYVENPAFDASGECNIPLILRAEDYVASDVVTHVEMKADEGVLASSGSMLNAYANDETTPFASYDLTTGAKLTGDNSSYTAVNTAISLPKNIDLYGSLPSGITVNKVRLEIVLINDSSLGVLINLKAQGENGKPLVATTGNSSVANKVGQTDVNRTAKYEVVYSSADTDFSQLVLDLNIKLIPEVTASHTFAYKLNNDGKGYAVSKGSTALIGEAIIPSYYDGLLVTSIGSFSNHTLLTNIKIPNSITMIGKSAFYKCTSLTSITIPESVTSIWGSAFYGCTSLTSITIPESVTSIGGNAFAGCTSLTSMTIPDGVTTIGSRAFANCTGLTSMTIPDGVTSIGNNAFNGCTSLTSITIPESVTSIGDNAFYGCTGLTSMTIPDGVTTIGSEAFANCTGLTSITIPNSVTSIDNYAFADCTNLTSIIFSNTAGWKAGTEAIDVTNAETNAINMKNSSGIWYDKNLTRG